MTIPDDRLAAAYQTALAALLAERAPAGHWVGELSTSALSTATAVSALTLVDAASHQALISGGLSWLAANQNDDGGWGDTVRSFSNISTTMLCRAAFHLTGAAGRFAATLERADAFMIAKYGPTSAEHAEAVRRRYGKDRTFAVPILTTTALAGLTGWQEVAPLPFELACLPQAWYRFARLPVVSYALPALIAIGQAVHQHRPPRNPVTRLLRHLARSRSLRVLEAIQPSSGGFLEAVPLTSFVTLSLASIGHSDHPVACKGVEFLVRSVRPDGSWPIDSNLATWVTTLSINALAAAGELANLDRKDEVRSWLLRQQGKERHAYTGAAPGAWGWTDLPGSVPDADDTPGALLALANLVDNDETRTAAVAGLRWLIDLQNRDGGWPTFCRGWGHLPFDRSGPDLTAHALRAVKKWTGLIFGFVPTTDVRCRLALGGHSPGERKLFWEVPWSIARGIRYLERTQRPDGSWLPLWFGNQHAPDEENPVYGTARVLAAYRDLDMMTSAPAQRAVNWLVAAQNDDGGWGGVRGAPSSTEETALAVEVLLDAGPNAQGAVNNGLRWLVERIESGTWKDPAPIGFYFAKLWYSERLYPLIFAVAALGRARIRLREQAQTDFRSLTPRGS